MIPEHSRDDRRDRHQRTDQEAESGPEETDLRRGGVQIWNCRQRQCERGDLGAEGRDALPSQSRLKSRCRPAPSSAPVDATMAGMVAGIVVGIVRGIVVGGCAFVSMLTGDGS